ncbi:MAG: hypothetical protein MJB57_01835 [Gemmatimonadetes bacterium]|nr:hypothetical protein [Gemmatimonadota bacterium]
MTGPIPDLSGTLQERLPVLETRLGRPVADRTSGADRWILYEGDGWSLRLRARASREGEDARVRSWTVTFDEGFETLSQACTALGLPAVVAEEVARGDHASLRAPLSSDARGAVCSLTALRRDGRVRSVTVFDEAPDWGPEDTSS